jgi:hypothetical protein
MISRAIRHCAATKADLVLFHFVRHDEFNAEVAEIAEGNISRQVAKAQGRRNDQCRTTYH